VAEGTPGSSPGCQHSRSTSPHNELFFMLDMFV
jgi:hypothetical protein